MTATGIELDLAKVLADAAPAIDAPGTLEETMEAIANAARDTVPGFNHVGVTVLRQDGVYATLASTGGLVLAMDAVQFRFDQGPCLDALRQEKVVVAENLSTRRQQWPIYAPHASKAGIRAQMGMHIHTSDETLGSLNFYSTAAPTIDPGAPRHAELFASYAAIALDHARHVDEAVASSLSTRELIGQAVGRLMERFDVSEDRAHNYLVWVAAAGNLKLRDAARAVVQPVDPRH